MPAQNGTAVFAGAGNLSATTRLALRATAAFPGASTLTITSVRGALQVSASLPGVGSLSVALQKFISASFAGSSTLSATASKFIAAQFPGAGFVLASAVYGLRATVRLAGSSSVSVGTVGGVGVFGRFPGSSSLTANPIIQWYGTNPATLPGVGRLCATAFIRAAAPGRTSNLIVTGPGATNNAVA